MFLRAGRASLLCFSSLALAYQASDRESPSVQLTVPSGTPLRAYLTKRIPKRLGAPVEATTISPIYTFDRETIPAGSQLTGSVSQLQAVSKITRVSAMMGGDFTPLRVAQVQFTSVRFPGGQVMPIKTYATPGLNTLYDPRPSKRTAPISTAQNKGLIGSAKQAAKNQVSNSIDSIRSIPSVVRSPDKVERLEDFLLAKLPYHPQYLRKHTRIDAELAENLNFGAASMPLDSLGMLGTAPPKNSVVAARLLTPVHSVEAQKGQVVEAVISEPLFSADKHLILPEGTRLSGAVVNVKKAGWFRHAGRLRLTFSELSLTPETQALASAARPQDDAAQRSASLHTQAALSGAEASGAPVSVNSEGAAQAKESKTRFINVGIAAVVASAAGDGDRDRTGGPNSALSAPSRNVGGNVLGGGSGFGLLGSAAAQLSPAVGSALGYYGLAWSVYTNLIARGHEVDFNKNAVVNVGFNARDSKPDTSKTPATVKSGN